MSRRLLGRSAAWLFVLVLLLTAVRAGRIYVDQVWRGPGPLSQNADFVVPHGTTNDVGEALHKAGIVDSVLAFRIAEYVTDGQGPLHAGEFAFPARISLTEVFQTLRHGRQVEHHLTIPEGLTGKDIAALINAAPAMTGRVSLAREGAILPNTYDYLYGTPRPVLLARAEHALAAAMGKLWPDRAPNLPLTSPEEAITLASIVERETAKPEERPMVAAVYLNRLAAGMKLQADPTVIYGLSDGSGVMDRPLDHADLLTPSAYNTYLNTGLPPGPIAAPGIASIRAVLHPADSDALYFVADGQGGHVFSHDYAGQMKNVAKLRKLDAARVK
ncbi:MAG TPA: endolytic transglycosylase MltG [Acidisoma sp.]|uniref:endolytic transglycosylase MltG n=1 Tax=Acidisoma sp. TaxID=1872115 RepID=UPI002BBC4BED|nr:endolytic transglycosylase MltG [Acidisoma sp.]HTI01827.1 endolytic transglycosylase MltG [Acidisoma sp.]